jgi:hypothetical protein
MTTPTAGPGTIVLPRRILDIVTAAERVSQDGLRGRVRVQEECDAKVGRMREECDTSARRLRQESEAAVQRVRRGSAAAVQQQRKRYGVAVRGLERDSRPFVIQHSLHLAIRKAINTYGAVSNRGVARPAPSSADQLRRDYAALLERVTAAVHAHTEAVARWNRTPWFVRLFV